MRPFSQWAPKFWEKIIFPPQKEKIWPAFSNSPQIGWGAVNFVWFESGWFDRTKTKWMWLSRDFRVLVESNLCSQLKHVRSCGAVEFCLVWKWLVRPEQTKMNVVTWDFCIGVESNVCSQPNSKPIKYFFNSVFYLGPVCLRWSDLDGKITYFHYIYYLCISNFEVTSYLLS